ncbi:hypothetical protein GCM10009753_44410 [Streptantibioticus ferralitis]
MLLLAGPQPRRHILRLCPDLAEDGFGEPPFRIGARTQGAHVDGEATGGSAAFWRIPQSPRARELVKFARRRWVRRRYEVPQGAATEASADTLGPALSCREARPQWR